ncbi:DUR3, partial [Symbiodinium necroappetens]
FFGDNTPLPIESGYAIVLGFGAFFSVLTTVLVYLDKYANGTEHTSEFFNTAGRSVKTGLTASVIVSQWTWAATLLQSSNVAWQYGVSGPFWYASGATIQVLLFGILAIEIKRRVDTDLASFLIPWGVILYTAAGGLKATFMASYLHTAIIFLVLVVCVYTVYVKNFSSDVIYAGLQQVSSYSTTQCEQIFKQGTQTFFEAGKYACGPVPENEGGSYLTMLSGGGTKFGIINIVGNFGTVFVDQSYWQSAIAAKPTSSAEGIAVSSLVTYDIYKTYINPKCTGQQALFISKVVVVVFGLLMGGLGVALNHMGLNLGWVYQFMGNAIGSAVEMLEQDMSGLDDEDYTSDFLDAAKWWIQKWGWGFTILMVLIWPLLSLPAGVFTTDYFAFWVFISIAWSFVATFVIIVLPIQESWGAIMGVCYFMVGKQAPQKAGAAASTAEKAPETQEVAY